jgi:hypothetical protein
MTRGESLLSPRLDLRWQRALGRVRAVSLSALHGATKSHAAPVA